MNPALRLELRRSRQLLLWLAVVALAYGAFLSVFYPVFRDNSKLLDQYLSLFPKEFLTAFGMEGSLADPGVFFSTYIGGMLWPIVAAIAGISMATRPTASDLERGFLELPLSTPLSRVRYFQAASIIDQGRFPVGDFAVFATVAVAAWALALWAFRRRDLAA
jgi:hypothetical protein